MDIERIREKFVQVGKNLERRRIEVEFEEEYVAKQLKISIDELRKIESGNVLEDLHKIYYKGIVQKYCKLLKIKYHILHDFFAKDFDDFDINIANKFIAIRTKKKDKMHEISFKIISIIAISLIMISIVSSIIREQTGQKATEISINF